VNQIMHLWADKDLKERAEVRVRVLQDPGWQAFVAQAQPMLYHMQSTILMLAKFSPLH